MSLGELRPQTGLVALYHLNGNSTDSSGNGNNGTDTAITYSQANGKFGQGAGFNGSSSKILVNSTLGVAYNGACTYNVWVKMNSEISSGRQFFINQIWDGSQNIRNYIEYDYNSGTRRIRFARDGATSSAVNYTITLGNTNWYMFTYIYDGTYIKGYVNGSYIDQAAGTNTASSASVGNWLSLGDMHDSINGDLFYSNIKMDEPSVFSVAKSASWVRQQYSLGRFGEL